MAGIRKLPEMFADIQGHMPDAAACNDCMPPAHETDPGGCPSMEWGEAEAANEAWANDSKQRRHGCR